MSGWKHTFEVAACDWTGDTDMEYPVCGAADGDIGCGHTKVEPDPTSPCGWALAVDDEPCGDPANSYWHEHIDCHDEDHDHCDVCHPHVPTRCLNCQHPISPIKAGPAVPGEHEENEHG